MKTAYAHVYDDMETKQAAISANPDAKTEAEKKPSNALDGLVNAQKEYTKASLDKNNTTVRASTKQSKDQALSWLDKRIGQLESEIKDLKIQLSMPKAVPEEASKKGQAPNERQALSNGDVSKGGQATSNGDAANAIRASQDGQTATEGRLSSLPVVDENGIQITEDQLTVDASK